MTRVALDSAVDVILLDQRLPHRLLVAALRLVAELPDPPKRGRWRRERIFHRRRKGTALSRGKRYGAEEIIGKLREAAFTGPWQTSQAMPFAM